MRVFRVIISTDEQMSFWCGTFSKGGTKKENVQ